MTNPNITEKFRDIPVTVTSDDSGTSRPLTNSAPNRNIVPFVSGGWILSLHMCLISFFRHFFPLCGPNGYEKISLGDDFIEQRLTVHFHSRAYKGLFLKKNE